MTKNAKMLTTEEVAHLAGVKTSTIRCYRCRPGVMPEPDEYVGGYVPRWKASTIREWLRTRRGVGRPTGS